MKVKSIKNLIRNFILRRILKTNFDKEILSLVNTEEYSFDLSDLKETLDTDDEIYLLSLAKNVKEKGLGTYYYADATVERLKLNKTNIEEYFHSITKSKKNDFYIIVPIIISVISLIIAIVK